MNSVPKMSSSCQCCPLLRASSSIVFFFYTQIDLKVKDQHGDRRLHRSHGPVPVNQYTCRNSLIPNCIIFVCESFIVRFSLDYFTSLVLVRLMVFIGLLKCRVNVLIAFPCICRCIDEPQISTSFPSSCIHFFRQYK